MNRFQKLFSNFNLRRFSEGGGRGGGRGGSRGGDWRGGGGEDGDVISLDGWIRQGGY